MMYLQLGEAGFDRDRPKLVLHHDDSDPTRIATITAKRPNQKSYVARNWVVWNGASQTGVVQPGWEDNAKFFKYLKDAPGATLKGGEVVQRSFSIAEEARSGWWKQHNPQEKAWTIIPTHLRFRYPDADQGA